MTSKTNVLAGIVLWNTHFVPQLLAGQSEWSRKSSNTSSYRVSLLLTRRHHSIFKQFFDITGFPGIQLHSAGFPISHSDLFVNLSSC